MELNYKMNVFIIIKKYDLIKKKGKIEVKKKSFYFKFKGN